MRPTYRSEPVSGMNEAVSAGARERACDQAPSWRISIGILTGSSEAIVPLA
jgi:hypothetical protein